MTGAVFTHVTGIAGRRIDCLYAARPKLFEAGVPQIAREITGKLITNSQEWHQDNACHEARVVRVEGKTRTSGGNS